MFEMLSLVESCIRTYSISNLENLLDFTVEMIRKNHCRNMTALNPIIYTLHEHCGKFMFCISIIVHTSVGGLEAVQKRLTKLTPGTGLLLYVNG